MHLLAKILAGPQRRNRRSAGASLPELLVVIAILGAALGAASLYLKPLEAPIRTSGELVDALIKQTRAKAMATTSVYRIRPAHGGLLVVESANSCSAAAWTNEPRFDLRLPSGVVLAETDWSICFNARGTASSNVVLTFSHPQFESRQLEVLLGGMVRWLS